MRIGLVVIQGAFCLLGGATEASASGVLDFVYPCFEQGQPQAGQKSGSFSSSQVAKPGALMEISDTLVRLPKLKVSIVGNADSSECAGDECMALSERRANAIYTWLVASGVSKSQISESIGVGTTQPMYYGIDEKWHWANRCVAVDPVDGG